MEIPNQKNSGIERICFAFVILHFGDPAVTDTCVQSILRMERTEDDPVQVVIVDNDPKTKGAEADPLAGRYRAYPSVTVLPAPAGAGFSRANNEGYCFAREKLGAECIIVCNNDIEFVQKDFLKRLRRSAARMDCHVLGPSVIRRGSHEPQNPMDTRIRTEAEARYTIRMNRTALKVFPAVYPILRLQAKKAERERLREKKQNYVFYRTVHKHIVPFGACLIFTPQFVKSEERAFEPETQFYYEEYILADRCFRKGYETGYDPSMRVLHETGSATKQSTKTERARMKRMMQYTADACAVYLGNFAE